MVLEGKSLILGHSEALQSQRGIVWSLGCTANSVSQGSLSLSPHTLTGVLEIGGREAKPRHLIKRTFFVAI